MGVLMQPTLVKVSGHELDDPAYLAQFAAAIKSLNTPTVVVHGGGAEITAMQKVMGIEPRYLDGVRITDRDSLRIAEMVMSGSVNKRLVRCLLNAGLDALGLSGVDRGLVRATQMQVAGQDMGFTGEVVAVRGEVVTSLLEQGITPVISPVSLGEETNFNVNADHVAGALATAINASRVVFLTNVEGVLVDNQVVATLTPAGTQALINNGTIFGGMIPKVKTALHALESGVQSAVITNLNGLASGGGTVFAK
ncbi:MAG: acetylglutamate kinase [Anaerolineae bacterium]|nr:acetylglutamate kinase [Anaerolineae bacterium]